MIKEIIDKQALALNEKNRAGRSPTRNYFYASEAGKCHRAIFFSMTGVKGKPKDARTIRIFQNGDSVHERLCKYLKEAGVLVCEEKEMNNQSPEIHGRVDAIVELNGEQIPLEFKSANIRTLAQPYPEHVKQIMLYMHVGNYKKGMLVYESKQTQEIFEFEIVYDEEHAKKILESFKEVEECYKKNETPKRADVMVRAKYPCTYCDYADECWKE